MTKAYYRRIKEIIYNLSVNLMTFKRTYADTFGQFCMWIEATNYQIWLLEDGRMVFIMYNGLQL